MKKNLTLKCRAELKAFVSTIFSKEKKKLQHLSYIFCSDDYLLEVNKNFLKHDYYTDIITFDLSESPKAITGDIYISIDRVRDNAKQEGVSINHELHRVIFHGALHLCGYKDKKPTEQKLMRSKEDLYLKSYFK
ncbi:MAG: rRNA maturation RNase YbeY [Bacteroidota bacterium]